MSMRRKCPATITSRRLHHHCRHRPAKMTQAVAVGSPTSNSAIAAPKMTMKRLTLNWKHSKTWSPMARKKEASVNKHALDFRLILVISVFMPKGRQQEGNDLFTLGKLTLYINQGVCFVSDGAGDWVPTSLTNIYDKAMQQA